MKSDVRKILICFLFIFSNFGYAGNETHDKSATRPGAVSLPSEGGTVEKSHNQYNNNIFTGSFQYSVPLDIPKGPNGIKPSLSISYSTDAGQGPLAKSWTISIPKIEMNLSKGIPEYQKDEKGVFLDALSYNGIPLNFVRTGDGDELIYSLRKSKEFMTFHYVNNKNLNFNANFTGWILKFANGNTFYFESSLSSTVLPENNDLGKISQWYLTRQEDSNKNEIHYFYKKNQGEVLLEHIEYGPHQIIFSTIDQERDDTIINTKPGYMTKISSALYGEIRIENQKNLYRRYCFLYRDSVKSIKKGNDPFIYSPHCAPLSTYKSPYAKNGEELINTTTLLEGIFSFAEEGSYRNAKERFQEYQFTYSPWFLTDVENKKNKKSRKIFYEMKGLKPKQGTRLAFMDVNQNGLPDILNYDIDKFFYFENPDGHPHQEKIKWEKFKNIPFKPQLLKSNHILGDMTGNGRADYIIANPKDHKVVYYPGIDKGFSPDSVEMEVPKKSGCQFIFSNSRQFDLNGNGLLDFISLNTDSTGLYFDILLNQDGKNFKRVKKRISKDLKKFIRRSNILTDQNVYFADVNGNGLLDLVFMSQKKIYVFYHTGDLQENKTDLFSSLTENNTGIESTLDQKTISQNGKNWLIDANGNGLPDLISFVGYGAIYVRLNNGQGFFSYKPDYQIVGKNEDNINWSHMMATDFTVVDIDGDGQQEIVCKYLDKKVYALNFNLKGRDTQIGEEKHLIKSGLLTRVLVESGERIDIQYSTSMDEYKRDRNKLSREKNELPFPRVLAKRIVVTPGKKAESGHANVKTVEYLYGKGFYDANMREFRGFGEVTSIEYGDDTQDGLVTSYKFHSGKAEDGKYDLAYNLTGELKEMAYYPLKSFVSGNDYYVTQEKTKNYQIETAFIHSLSTYTVGQEPLVLESGTRPLEKTEYTYNVKTTDHQQSLISLASSTKTRFDVESDGLSSIKEEQEVNPYGQMTWHKKIISSDIGTFLPDNLELITTYNYSENLYENHIYNKVIRETSLNGKGQKLKEVLKAFDSKGNIDKESQWIAEDLYQDKFYKYDLRGNRISENDGKGHIWETLYDDEGLYPLQQINPLGHVKKYFYNCSDISEYDDYGFKCYDRGNVLKHIDENNRTTFYHYDRLGRKIHQYSKNRKGTVYSEIFNKYIWGKEGLPNRILTQIKYNNNQLYSKVAFYNLLGENMATLSQADQGGYRSKVETYNLFNRRGLKYETYLPYFVESGETPENIFEKGEVPRPISSIKKSTYHFDILGRPLKIEYPNGKNEFLNYGHNYVEKVVQYKGQGKKTQGKLYQRKERLIKNAEDKTIQIINDKGYALTFKRDELGRTIELIDQKGNITRYGYNGLSLKNDIFSPSAGKLLFKYNENGLMEEKQVYDLKDHLVGSIFYSYDELDRLRKKFYNTELQTEYFYDSSIKEGNHCSLKDDYSVGQITLIKNYNQHKDMFHFQTYNVLGNKVCEDKVIGKESYVQTYQYDYLKRLTKIVNPSGYETKYEYGKDLLLKNVSGIIDNVLYNEKKGQSDLVWLKI